jgi:hypothetical protein
MAINWAGLAKLNQAVTDAIPGPPIEQTNYYSRKLIEQAWGESVANLRYNETTARWFGHAASDLLLHN